MKIPVLIQNMVESGAFSRVINNPLAQFGSKARAYKGAEFLPESEKPENSYTEEVIEYRTLVANDGTRYSPAQKKQGVITGTFRVDLAHQDVASEFKGEDYDALIKLVEQTMGRQGVEGGDVTREDMLGMTKLINWSDVTLSRPLLENIERARWMAIVDAQVLRAGDNGYNEKVNYSNPSGHRASAGGTWSSDAYDPYVDIMAMFELLAAKGYIVNRIVTTQTVISILSKNAIMRARVGHIRVKTDDNTVVNQSAGRASLQQINIHLNSEELPGLERYDLQYRTETSSGKFLASNSGSDNYVAGGVMAFFCTTGRDRTIDRADLEPLIIPSTVGYVGIGRAAGKSSPGRATHVRSFDDKPPRVEGQAWQASLPVIQDPEAIAVIKGIV